MKDTVKLSTGVLTEKEIVFFEWLRYEEELTDDIYNLNMSVSFVAQDKSWW